MIERERPRLRELRVRVEEEDGVRSVRVVDPLGVGPGPHAAPCRLSETEWRVARLLDGSRTLGEVHAELGDDQLGEREVVRLVEGLSRRFLLDDDAFEEELYRQLDAFRAQPHRALAGSGREYTADNIDLRIQLGGIVANDWDMPEIEPLHGLILPAAPFGPAARLYARGYGALRHQVRDVARIVLLGASPAPLDRLLAPLTLPSRTAFGLSEVDLHALRALAVVPGRDELAHRDALVLERHQLFTTLLAPHTPVLPVLVGATRDPDEPGVESAVEALKRVLELPGRTLLIAAADLGHLEPADEAAARALRALDADLSDHATRLDAAGFWSAAMATGELPLRRTPTAPYLLLRALAGTRVPLRGAVAGYQQLRGEDARDSALALAVFEDVAN